MELVALPCSRRRRFRFHVPDGPVLRDPRRAASAATYRPALGSGDDARRRSSREPIAPGCAAAIDAAILVGIIGAICHGFPFRLQLPPTLGHERPRPAGK